MIKIVKHDGAWTIADALFEKTIYYINVKHFEEPSKYGIQNSRIAKVRVLAECQFRSFGADQGGDRNTLFQLFRKDLLKWNYLFRMHRLFHIHILDVRGRQFQSVFEASSHYIE